MPKNLYPHNAEKKYFENLASNILKGVLYLEFEDIQLHDKPDLLCSPGNVGVEVRRVMYPNAGMASAFFKESDGKTLEEISEEKIKCLKDMGYEAMFLLEGNRMSGIKRIVEPISTNLLLNAFCDKLEKLNDYEEVTAIDLFLIFQLPNWYQPYQLEEFTTEAQIKQENCTKRFRRVYVFQWNEMFVCDMTNGSVMQIAIPVSFMNYCEDDAKNKALCSK